ncbi:MAG TPA: hypothetical protein VMV27_07715 [Candidatus Binataceae bacterium]|nr:hypothetical protein [Candidatus Binataceae bacterium]
MITPAEVRAELAKIRTVSTGKNVDVPKASAMFGRLQSVVFDDLSKTGDQRVRAILRLIMEFKL